MILAGGLGKRLRPLTKKIPKPLLPIGDSTAIEICIQGLAKHGFREIYIATRYKADLVEEALGDGSHYGVELHYSIEPRPLGTCGPLSLLKEQLTEPFLLINGDVITDVDFGKAYRWALEQGTELTLVTKEDVLSSRYGVVQTTGDSVTGIDEKPRLSTEILAGIYVISPSVFDLIPDGKPYGIDELIDDLLAKDRGVSRYTTDAYWRDVGEIQSFKAANREVPKVFRSQPPGSARQRAAAGGRLDYESLDLEALGSSPGPVMPGWIPPESQASISRFLNSPWVIVLALFSLATINYALKNAVSFGETQTLMYAKQFAEGDGFLPGDWYLNVDQPVRVPYQVLIYPLIKFFSLPTVSLLARLLGYFCVATALGLIADRLRINAAFAWIGLGAFLWFDQALLPGEEWILKRTESKVIAYALVLFALRALIGKRLGLAAALAGAATTFHILVGGWSTVALGLTVLSGKIGGWRERAYALGWWCVTGSVAIYCVVLKLLERAAPDGFDATYMWTHFRNPHYLEIGYWDLYSLETFVFLLLVGTLWWAPALFPEREGYVITSRFALWTLVPFALGVAVQPFSFAAEVLQYLPFRVADTLIPLIGFLLAAKILLGRLLRPPVNILAAALLVIFNGWTALDGLERGIYQQVRYPRGGYWDSGDETLALYGLCDWVQENTPRGALMISSPEINVISYLCERPVVVVFRDVPSGDADFAEWYRRLVAFNGGVEPERRGYSARSEIGRNFDRLSEEQYLELGEKYGSEYLIVHDRPSMDLLRLYLEDDWAVYQLRRP